ncbi:caspase domain-domain-containing protein [Leucosporidium creatinivorum]|uniref:Caspase domain-domain-containing protein n=1 Tax=Leucosporidium creatinivorum TaxID=106004 RepID=A0A1Y2G3T7_9BASI|nr:caspase domain-domain-containing protein [Leucosporidium creatinivorum]
MSGYGDNNWEEQQQGWGGNQQQWQQNSYAQPLPPPPNDQQYGQPPAQDYQQSYPPAHSGGFAPYNQGPPASFMPPPSSFSGDQHHGGGYQGPQPPNDSYQQPQQSFQPQYSSQPDLSSPQGPPPPQQYLPPSSDYPQPAYGSQPPPPSSHSAPPFDNSGYNVSAPYSQAGYQKNSYQYAPSPAPSNDYHSAPPQASFGASQPSPASAPFAPNDYHQGSYQAPPPSQSQDTSYYSPPVNNPYPPPDNPPYDASAHPSQPLSAPVPPPPSSLPPPTVHSNPASTSTSNVELSTARALSYTPGAYYDSSDSDSYSPKPSASGVGGVSGNVNYSCKPYVYDSDSDSDSDSYSPPKPALSAPFSSAVPTTSTYYDGYYSSSSDSDDEIYVPPRPTPHHATTYGPGSTGEHHKPQHSYSYSDAPATTPVHYSSAAPSSSSSFGPPKYQGGQTHHQPRDEDRGRYSNCTGKKRGLYIAINYPKGPGHLLGCHNDANRISTFMREKHQFRDVKILMDKPGHIQPTRANILDAMQWLVKDAEPNDSLFFHYSGHGGQVEDRNGDEEDGFDESIVPLDYKTAGQIIDDDMHHIMVASLPGGCRLTAIFDSCHSGSALDLAFTYSRQGKLKSADISEDVAIASYNAHNAYQFGDWTRLAITAGRKALSKNPSAALKKTRQLRVSDADVIMWSGCKDEQTSADASLDIDGERQHTGAMSHAFIKALTEYPEVTYVQLLNLVRDILQEGQFKQLPQLSCAHELDTDLIVIF